MDKSLLIEQLDQSHEMLWDAVRQVDPNLVVEGQWRLRDVLIHMTAWDAVSVDALNRFIHGRLLTEDDVHDIESFNKRTVGESKKLNHDQVIEKWEQTRRDLNETFMKVPKEKFNRELLFPWGDWGTAAEMIHALAVHETEHAQAIQDKIGTA